MKKIGKDSEFELFLDVFKNLPKEKFAVIKISGQSLEKNMDVIAEDIAFLNKLEIYPIIVHGAGSVLDKKLFSKKINGIRLTSKYDIGVIKEVFSSLSNLLKEKIIENGGSAKVVEDVFECNHLEEYGYVGEVKDVDVVNIKKAIDNNFTPIISPIGKEYHKHLNINADTAAKSIVKAIVPRKFILLTETGGILGKNKQVIPFINLSCEDEIAHVNGGMLLKINEIRELLKDLPDCSTVIISAKDILKELFTIKGSGTFLKYHSIKTAKDIDLLDKKRLKTLIEDAFDKKLVEGYFDDGIKEIFYQKDYEGVAIIKKINNVPYLDKFAVAKFRQGTGLGKSLWLKLIKKYPQLIWRATPENTFNLFYMKNCDGFMKFPNWNVYWTKVKDKQILSTVSLIVNKPKTVLSAGEKND